MGILELQISNPRMIKFLQMSLKLHIQLIEREIDR